MNEQTRGLANWEPVWKEVDTNLGSIYMARADGIAGWEKAIMLRTSVGDNTLGNRRFSQAILINFPQPKTSKINKPANIGFINRDMSLNALFMESVNFPAPTICEIQANIHSGKFDINTTIDVKEKVNKRIKVLGETIGDNKAFRVPSVFSANIYRGRALKAKWPSEEDEISKPNNDNIIRATLGAVHGFDDQIVRLNIFNPENIGEELSRIEINDEGIYIWKESMKGQRITVNHQLMIDQEAFRNLMLPWRDWEKIMNGAGGQTLQTVFQAITKLNQMNIFNNIINLGPTISLNTSLLKN